MTTSSSRRKSSRAKTEVAPDASLTQGKRTHVDPVMAKIERIYAGILTHEEAEAFAASIGRKL